MSPDGPMVIGETAIRKTEWRAPCGTISRKWLAADVWKLSKIGIAGIPEWTVMKWFECNMNLNKKTFKKSDLSTYLLQYTYYVEKRGSTLPSIDSIDFLQRHVPHKNNTLSPYHLPLTSPYSIQPFGKKFVRNLTVWLDCVCNGTILSNAIKI